jgi:hypothetical protein
MKNGIIYDGPSAYDGKPIVVIATWSDRNSKTGGVLQTYILVRDIDPREASKSGSDFTICGACPHRGTPTDDPARKIAKSRTCYVNLGQGVLIAWRSYQRGVYPIATDVNSRKALGRGRVVRVGTYGDPAACPQHVWDQLLSESAAHMAYTHASGWRPDIAMQSADSLADAQAAWDQGQRTFRVVQSAAELTKQEVLCPASKEADYRTTCNACKLCGGLATKTAKSIAIVQH